MSSTLIGAIALGASVLTGFSDKDPLIQTIHSKVKATIEHSEDVPGLKSEVFSLLKPGLLQRWNVLVDKGVLEVMGEDKDVRPYFVALQAIVEHVLALELSNSVKSLTAVMHTPMPATPLCTEGEVSPELVSSSIQEDPMRIFTVKARPTIVRDYLYHGGDLYVVYPKAGRTDRTEDQQKIYQKALESYSTHLFDRPLDCQSMDNDLIGAFYLFKNAEGKLFGFAIKIPQANTKQVEGSFGLWFGEVNPQSPAYDRISMIIKTVLKDSPQPIPLPI